MRATSRSRPFDSRNFEAMIQAVERSSESAVVVFEDVDRMFEDDGTTPQYFLNVLDALL